MPHPFSDRRRSAIHFSVFIMLVTVLTGCAAVQTAYDSFDRARGVTGAYHSYQSVKDLRNVQPHFQGYGSVLVTADIQPREDAANLPLIFASNMAVYIQSTARVVRAPLQVCQSQNQCAGRVLNLSFKEDAYDRNVVQKLTVGDRIRGKLYFSVTASGRVLDEVQVELAENYATLAKLTSAPIAMSMLRSFPSSSGPENERIAEEMEKIPFVAPQYERTLGRAS
jgi:hypothetical protein